jgi:cellulose synthase (UDP-forming)
MRWVTLQPSVEGPDLPPRESKGRRTTIRVAAVAALAVTTLYLTWRTLFTLNLGAWWVSIPLLVLELHAFVGLGLFTFSLWDVDSLAPAPPVRSTNLRLAVLIPTYNESEEVLIPTVAAAVAMHLPHETWVLDDGDRPGVEALAHALGARYLTRPVHDHAKAGNLNHALTVVDVDVVAIFDADHVPELEFFEHTLGYFDDPRVGAVQTPQDFYNTTSFEHLPNEDSEPAWDRQAVHEETLFYRVIEPGKNRWHAAFWCGTNAAVRVSALRDVGGVSTDSVTEDIQTTVRLQRRGWRAVYHNEVLARGLVAGDAEQFRLQRHRWATGGMQLLRSDNPVTESGFTIPQRVAYAATLFGWFDSWRTLGYLVLPFVVLFTGASPITAPLGLFLAAFGTTFVLQQVALMLLSRGFHHPISSARFELMRLGSTIGATLTLFGGGSTTFRVTPKGRMGEERTRIPVPADLWILVGLSGASAVWFALTIAGLTPLHYGTPGVAWGALAWLVANACLLLSAARWISSAEHATELRRAVRFPVAATGTVDGRPCEVLDCSLSGALVELVDRDAARRLLVGATPRQFELALTGAALPLTAEVRSLQRRPGDATRIGLEFTPGQLRARAALATALFQGATAPVFDEMLVGEQVAAWDMSEPTARAARAAS